MAPIAIPTYRSFVKNKVFGRAADPISPLIPILSEVPATQLVKLVRYTPVSDDAVVDHIKGYVARTRDALPHQLLLEDDSPFADAFRALSSEHIDKIIEGDEETISHLFSHLPPRNSLLKVGSSYVDAFFGVVPNEGINAVRETLKKDARVEAYRDLINSSPLGAWSLRVRLQESGAFPERAELEYLIDRGVQVSDVYVLRGEIPGYNEATAHLRYFADAFSSQEAIACLEDFTPTESRNRAQKTLLGFARHNLAKEQTSALLSHVFGSIFGGHKPSSGVSE